jgi:hypothetical protein
MLAMVVNDDAGCLRPRGVLAFFASRLAPTGLRRARLFCGQKQNPNCFRNWGFGI